jgi:Amt family ammonium transporter
MAIQVKNKLGYDDSLDAFGIHGIGGITGALFLSFFIRPSWMKKLRSHGGSWTIWNQFGVQALAVVIAIVFQRYDILIILLVNKVVRFKFKASEDDEMAGLDRSYHGERGYGMLNPS